MADEDSGEKTEEPSQHRIDEFREKGQVSSSKEVNSVILLAATLLTLSLCAVYIYEILTEFITWIMALDARMAYEPKFFQTLFNKMLMTGLKCTAPVFTVTVIVSLLTQISQIGFIYSTEVLSIKLERINPLEGIKRLFSMKSVVEVLKGLLKFGIILSITYFVVQSNLKSFIGFLHVDITESLAYGQMLSLKLAFSILLGLVVVALGDFAWEKHSYKEKLRMTKQQVKDEHKQKEGNPEIKQKIKAIQRELSQKRMMADIPRADVIVTNPTHLSIAIKYNPTEMIAPEVLAKGADVVALRIREIAKEHNIPIVENVPLARAIYKTIKVGEPVPRSLYKAVAEVLAFVFRKKKQRKALGVGR